MKYGNSFSTEAEIEIAGETLRYHSLPALARKTGQSVARLPLSLRVLLENLLRNDDGDIVCEADIKALLDWSAEKSSSYEIQFTPARVLLQDFTGVPVVADLAAMRSALKKAGGQADRVNPLQPVDLVIDHSVQVDAFASDEAFAINARLDFERNGERYEFLKWGQQAFSNFQVVPPATGICHQVNLEYLAHVAMRTERLGQAWIYPDTLVGTDSHTPMVNGLGVLGWGVGGIEAEAAMLGQPCSMLIPDVVGFELTGTLRPGVTATDLVLTITQLLRAKGVVGKFVEFHGGGVSGLSIADRATISNMAPEYGATIGFWPVDQKTIDYLKLTGRGDRAKRTEIYYQAQEMWATDAPQASVEYSDRIRLNLQEVEPSVAGPAKPHDRSTLANIGKSFAGFLADQKKIKVSPLASETLANAVELRDGDIVIAAITSCTNTSNPALMIGAGLLARQAWARGLKPKPWVKTSFAPGSKAVTAYLKEAGLDVDLDRLGFNLVGYGCTTCIGNSGPLPEPIASAIETRHLTVAAVLSGNRNFEARIHPLVRANYLCSPPLVIAFALAGRIDIDLESEPIGFASDGRAVYLRDIWPNSADVEALMTRTVTARQFSSSYADVFHGDENWRSLKIASGDSYDWSDESTYIKRPPFLDIEYVSSARRREPIKDARILGLFGDFITTDHISPAGSIDAATPAGRYLESLGVVRERFNSYGARRGNHEVMVRGTFANVRLRNQMVDREGGFTRFYPGGQEMTIYDAATRYREQGVPLVIFAGREYGSGSSRDWAAKGTRLLGVRAVIAESFERIHRSNLIGMGVLPLEFTTGSSAKQLQIKGDERVTISGLEGLKPKATLTLQILSDDAPARSIEVLARVDTANELRYLDAGGILPYVLNRLS